MDLVNGVLCAAVAGCLVRIAVTDGRRGVIEPVAVLALGAAGLAWQAFGAGGDGAGRWFLGPAVGAGLGVAAAGLPMAVAGWRDRRRPLLAGDVWMLGGIGAVLGPAGLAWTLVLGSAAALAHRAWRRRGRSLGTGYCAFAPGYAAAALAVFAAVNAGIAVAQEARPIPADRGVVIATELAPLPDAGLPPELARLQVAVREAEPVGFAVLVRRIAEQAEMAVEVEERPARVADGWAEQPEPPATRMAFQGPLVDLVERVAEASGYDWTWREDAIVFYRYWDVDQRQPAAPAEPEPLPWVVDAGRHGTVRGVLADWADLAGWSLVWKPEREYLVGAGAEFSGEFLQVVDALLSAPAVKRSLVATAYPANRHLVIEAAGAVR